ncbi:MAG: CsgG/HfaB family protein [bacterium]
MRTTELLSIVTVTLLLPVCTVCAENIKQTSAAESTAAPRAFGRKQERRADSDIKTVDNITIAVTDFDSKAPGNPDLGQQLGAILTARLSIYDEFKLVERKKLRSLLKEHQLNLSGMVEANQATKVGKMLGAKIMVFGRAFTVDRDLYIIAKIVGTETSRVKGVIAKGKLESDLSDIIDQLVDKLLDGLEKWSPELLPKTEKFQNKVKIFKKRLKDMELPTLAVLVSEVHMNRRIADPAAETEMKRIFKEVGFPVCQAKARTTEGSPQDALRRRKAGSQKYAPNISLAGADIVITGEGLSEFGARIGGLISCVARLEVQATRRGSQDIIASERTTRRAVDLSEAIAGKTALQAAGHELAIKVIEKIAQEIKEQKDK